MGMMRRAIGIAALRHAAHLRRNLENRAVALACATRAPTPDRKRRKLSSLQLVSDA